MKARTGIVGAGFAGLGLALALYKRGYLPTILEKREEDQVAEGGIFLTLAPNGINALRSLGLSAEAVDTGIRTTGLLFRNENGASLSGIDYSEHEKRFGAPSVTIRRGALSRILIDAVKKAQVPLHFGAEVVGVQQHDTGIIAQLATGQSAEFDILIAADGLRSPLRRLAMPDLPGPVYNGLLGGGGVVDIPDVPSTAGKMIMTFGREATLGYIKQADGPVFWFNSFPSPQSRAQFADQSSLAAFVKGLHRTDPEVNQRIIAAAAPHIERFYPDFDIPDLASWTEGRIVLIGDAAHAVTPHSGQGASMALEDALVLAACLDAEQTYQAACARFEALRRKRVAAAVRLGRQGGAPKKALGWLARRIRDIALPIFVPLGQKGQEELFKFRVDRDPLANPVLPHS